MHIQSHKKLVLIGIFFYLPFASSGWSLLGHRIVGEIAESYCSKKTKRAIQEILGNESIAMTSNWMDFIKSDPTYNYLYNWHFVNLKGGLSSIEIENYLAKDTATDAYTKINFCIEQLKNRSVIAPETRLLYLRVLIHVIGDIHQPMHLGHVDDLGGNRVKVLWFNNPTNLHAVWDDKLIEYQDLSYTEYTKAINFTSKDQRKAWQAEPLSKWIIDTYQITSKLYDDIKQPDQKLEYKYNFMYISTVNEQLLKGGVHLAGVLNDIFG